MPTHRNVAFHPGIIRVVDELEPIPILLWMKGREYPGPDAIQQQCYIVLLSYLTVDGISDNILAESSTENNAEREVTIHDCNWIKIGAQNKTMETIKTLQSKAQF